ncbi:kinase-like domain-containing protein [Syncephalis fuscata]|nr:kinase-like domain-containing protein [Syncephalis fuscata]
MRSLSHPNIARLYGFRESSDYYYLILELLTGGELFHRIVKLTYFSESLSRHVILQVADGIRYLHEEKGVVHRDIKPENILFEPIAIRPSGPDAAPAPYDEDKVDEGLFVPGVGGGGIGRVKIADFGLSKEVWGEQTMTPCGTVGYTAPEIVNDERYSMGVDMWALGCVLYTMLCGFPPFYDENVQMLTEKVARGQYSFLSPWWDDISAEAKDLITHLLKVDPRERYTISEFLAHPWIQAGNNDAEALRQAELAAAAAHLSANGDINTDQAGETPFGLRTAALRRRADIPVTPLDTPEGAFAMKAAFDVSYAARRRRDASARRKQARQVNRTPAAHQQTAAAAASDCSPFDAAGAALDDNKKGEESTNGMINSIMSLQDIELSDRSAFTTPNNIDTVEKDEAQPMVITTGDENSAYYNHFRTSQYYEATRDEESDTPTSEDDDQPMVVVAADDSDEQRRRHILNRLNK